MVRMNELCVCVFWGDQTRQMSMDALKEGGFNTVLFKNNCISLFFDMVTNEIYWVINNIT